MHVADGASLILIRNHLSALTTFTPSFRTQASTERMYSRAPGRAEQAAELTWLRFVFP